MINISIIEDDPVVREEIQNFLNSQEDMFCPVAKESLELYLAWLNPEETPDIILMDIGLPGLSGISGIKIINEKYPDIGIIMFTIYNDSHKIFRSLCAGACGYILKNATFSEIRNAIKIVYEGGAFMSPQIGRKVLEYFRIGRKKNDPSPLTEKEKEIVFALVDGLSYKSIADKACISIETVRTHIKNIYKKLHVHSKAEVIRKSLNGEI